MARKKKDAPAAPAPQQAAPEQPGLDEAAIAVLKKYHVMRADGSWREVELAQGRGPIIDPGVVDRFLALDKSANRKPFDWMMFMAGGGKGARRASEQALAEIKELWVNEKYSEWTDSSGRAHPGVQEKEAVEAMWAKVEPEFFEEIMFADQDTLANRYDNEIFGYYHDWPGRDGIYERITKGVAAFQRNMTERQGGQLKVSIIAAARQKRAAAEEGEVRPVKQSLPQFESLEELEAFNKEFFLHFKRRAVEKDVRYVTKHPTEQGKFQHTADEVPVHENDTFRLLVPATIVASMRSGAQHVTDRLKGWCVSSPGQLDTAFDLSSPQSPHWSSYSSQGPFFFVIAKKALSDDTLQKVAIHFRNTKDVKSANYWDATDSNHTLEQILTKARSAGVEQQFRDCVNVAGQVVGNICSMVKSDVYSEAVEFVRQFLE